MGALRAKQLSLGSTDKYASTKSIYMLPVVERSSTALGLACVQAFEQQKAPTPLGEGLYVYFRRKLGGNNENKGANIKKLHFWRKTRN